MADRIRVLWLIKGLGPGGAERLLTAAAAARDRDQFEYEVAYLLPWKNHLVPEFEALGVAVHCLEVNDERNPAWAGRFRRLLRDRNYDIVHVHSPYAAGIGRLVVGSLPPASRPKLVSTEHNIWSSFSGVTRVLNRLTTPLDKARFAVSSDVQASMSPALRDGCEVVVHGVDLAGVRRALESRDGMRASLGLADSDVVVGTVGNYRHQKAYPNLLKAAAKVVAQQPSVRFVAVGQGPLEEEITSFHRHLGLGDRFQLLGYRPDAVDVMAACDIFTLASDYEGLPVALMEALVLGLPVSATRVGGIPEALTDGVEGLLVPPGQPEELAAALLQLARDPERRAVMGAAAAERGKDFDIARAVRRIEQRYREVVGVAANNEQPGVRPRVKRVLASRAATHAAPGLTVLIYHRVGGGTPDERDMATSSFAAQMEVLAARHRVVPIDTALDEVAAGDDSPKVVVTFDDGFADVHAPVLGVLERHRLPFTLYLATGYVGGLMHWDGSTAKAPGLALTWEQLADVMASGLCTIGNHTHSHARPEQLTEEELDRCTDEIAQRLGVTPQHFAYTWGIPVPAMKPALGARFRSAVTGERGRNHPGDDFLALRRIPVRGSDPLSFFEAKLTGNLWPERTYEAIVTGAKKLGMRA